MQGLTKLIPILLLFGLLGCSELVQPATPHEQEELALQAKHRPISDFIEAQGTFCWPDGAGGCRIFVPPVANFLIWTDRARNLSASVDYAGLADKALGGILGTSFSGTITERPQKDGRCLVHVVLHTENALTWVIDGFDSATDPLLFGVRATDVMEGAAPSLGSSHLVTEFTNTACGDPLPDLRQIQFAQFVLGEGPWEFRSISIRAQADGELRAAFGVPDGTRGRVQVVQTGLLMTGFRGATADAFPVENILLRRVGGR